MCPDIETSSVETTTRPHDGSELLILNSYGVNKVAIFDASKSQLEQEDFVFDPRTEIYKRYVPWVKKFKLTFF